MIESPVRTSPTPTSPAANSTTRLSQASDTTTRASQPAAGTTRRSYERAPSVIPPHQLRRRPYYFVAALCTIATTAGCILGWPSMRVVLEGEGLLASGCVLGDERGGRLFYVAGLCKSQELRLGLTYTIASWAAQGGRLFAGLALDAYGCRVTVTVSLLLCALGTSIVALSIADPAGRSEAPMRPWILQTTQHGIGGSGSSTSLPTQHLHAARALSPRRSSSPASRSASSCSRSAARASRYRCSRSRRSSPRTAPSSPLRSPARCSSRRACTCSSSCCSAPARACWSCCSCTPASAYASRPARRWPGQPHVAPPAGVSRGQPRLGAPCIWPALPFTVHAPVEVVEEVQRRSRREGSAAVTAAPARADPAAVPPKGYVPLRRRTFREQVGSRQYALLVLIFTVHLLQCQFLLGNVGTQLDEKGDDGTARITFSACLSLTILVSPLVGHFIDRFGFVVSFAVINSIFLAISVLLLLPSLAAQYVMAVLNAISRVSLWSCFFSYTGATFSFYHFGKLAGGGLLLAATVSLLQFPLLDLTLGPFEGDFTFVNALFAGMSCALYPAIFWLARIEARRLTEEIAVAASKPPDLPSSVETI